MLFCPCVVRKATAHIETKTLNMRHQAQKGFRGIFVGIPEHQKGYLVYVPSTRKVISSYDVVFDKSVSSALSYTSRPYSEAMVMLLAVTYISYATSLKEQTGDVITFARFEEGNILTETRHRFLQIYVWDASGSYVYPTCYVLERTNWRCNYVYTV